MATIRRSCGLLLALIATVIPFSAAAAFVGQDQRLLPLSFRTPPPRSSSSFVLFECDGAAVRSAPVGQRQVTPRNQPSSALFGMFDESEEIEGVDRIKACIPYFLPLIDGDGAGFGRYVYERCPPLGFLDELLLGPLVNIFHMIPFLGLGLFVALTLGTRFNTNMNRNVRFSAQQAALIDVALVFPELIASGFQEEPLPRYIVEPCANFVWYAYVSVVLYSLYCNLRGKKPDQIPYLSASADMMVGPF